MSDIQKKCSTPERTVVGHPFNPPYILPLVEIVGGKKTDVEAIDWAYEFYKFSGKAYHNNDLIAESEFSAMITSK